MYRFCKRVWAEINLDNLIYNFNCARRVLSEGTKLCCVVKADAYGHYAPRVARELEAAGADFFAVSNIDEAIQLRNSEIKRPILILGYTPAECADLLAKYDVAQCVYSLEYARMLSDCAVNNGVKIKIHIKVDSGMGRLGFRYYSDGVISEIASVCRMRGLEAEGIFTHFAMSDEGDAGCEYTVAQYKRFSDIVSLLKAQGLAFEYVHCANTAAAFDYADFQMNAVRIGIALYGLSPSAQSLKGVTLKPVMALKTVVSQVKTLRRGEAVSYGCDFVADREMRVATVPLGYADGLWRSNGNGALKLWIKNTPAPIIGRICMDQLMLDVSLAENVAIGDEVTVFGAESTENTADTLALLNNTINYEIVCAVGKRVPRVFIKDGKTDGIYLEIFNSTVN